MQNQSFLHRPYASFFPDLYPIETCSQFSPNSIGILPQDTKVNEAISKFSLETLKDTESLSIWNMSRWYARGQLAFLSDPIYPATTMIPQSRPWAFSHMLYTHVPTHVRSQDESRVYSNALTARSWKAHARTHARTLGPDYPTARTPV